MNYSDFFKMIPEASLVAILIVLFVADFATAKAEERKWFKSAGFYTPASEHICVSLSYEYTTSVRWYVCNKFCCQRYEGHPFYGYLYRCSTESYLGCKDW